MNLSLRMWEVSRQLWLIIGYGVIPFFLLRPDLIGTDSALNKCLPARSVSAKAGGRNIYYKNLPQNREGVKKSHSQNRHRSGPQGWVDWRSFRAEPLEQVV